VANQVTDKAVRNLKNIPKFFHEIMDRILPDTVNQQKISEWGFKSSYDKDFIKLLKHMGFIDATNKPTERYIKYFGGDKRVLVDGIKEAYSDLYQEFDDPTQKTDNTLIDLLRPRNKDLDKDAVQRIVSTFKALCRFADSNEAPAEASENKTDRPVNAISEKKYESDERIVEAHTSKDKPSVTINVQITLPETASATMYEELFSAMKKYLYDDNE